MSEREKIIEVMAAAMRLGYAQSGSRCWDAVPERIKGAYLKDATAALAAIEAAGVWLVPVEATHEMADVGTEARWQSAMRDANNVREIWRAMLAASPYAKDKPE